MHSLRRHRFAVLFLVLLTFCSTMVIRQFMANQAKHLEVREAFILLHATNHGPEAQKLYEWLIRKLETESIKTLLEDEQRLSALINPSEPQPQDLLWRYHRSVANELEKRSQSTLIHALKLVEEVD